MQHPIDLNEEMVRTTFEIIADVTFSDENGFDRQAVHKALNDYMDSSARVSVLDFFNLPDWVPRPNRIISRSAMQTIHTLAKEVITAREGAGASTPPDLLDLLFDGEDPETKRKMDPIVIRDNLLAFITAGHETTALTLSWALYLLAFDPAVQDKARQEVRDVIGDGPLSIDHVERLTYVRQVIDETLRLYPPAPIVSRTAQQDDVLCGRKIRAGQTVLIPIYCLHRHKMLWEDPDAFRPERFGADQKHDRFSYLPFIDGPRVCIGASFALQEAVIILATLLQKFEFDAIPSKQPVPEMILTMRPTGGVWLKVRPAS
jgi:cytochrome P450